LQAREKERWNGFTELWMKFCFRLLINNWHIVFLCKKKISFICQCVTLKIRNYKLSSSNEPPRSEQKRVLLINSNLQSISSIYINKLRKKDDSLTAKVRGQKRVMKMFSKTNKKKHSSVHNFQRFFWYHGTNYVTIFFVNPNTNLWPTDLDCTKFRSWMKILNKKRTR